MSNNRRGDVSLVFAAFLGLVFLSAAGYFAYQASRQHSASPAKAAATATPTSTPYAGAGHSTFAAVIQVRKFYDDYNQSKDQALAKQNIDPDYYKSAILKSAGTDPILCGNKSTEPYRTTVTSSDANTAHIQVKQQYTASDGSTADNLINVDFRLSDMLITNIGCLTPGVPH